MEWADFRIVPEGDPGGPGWVAKLYSGVTKQDYVDTQEDQQGRLHKIYTVTPTREAYLVRWHPFGVLELRVPLERQLKLLFGSVQGLWNAIERVVSVDSFISFDLYPACRKILSQYAENKTLYRIGDVHTEEGESSLRISATKPNKRLMDDEKRRQAADLFEKCRLLVVVWLLNEETHDTKDELRTTIGKLRENELVFISKTTEKALLHVIHQLRNFSS